MYDSWELGRTISTAVGSQLLTHSNSWQWRLCTEI